MQLGGHVGSEGEESDGSLSKTDHIVGLCFSGTAHGGLQLGPKSALRAGGIDTKPAHNSDDSDVPLRLFSQVSHTCFFSIELPPYSTEERMRQGLLTAIHFGMGGILIA